MLLVFYVGQVVFFLFYIYIYRFIYRNVSRLLVNNCCMLLACGFIMLTRLSLDKGLDKAFKQFVIVAAAAILSWLVPFIMERFWQLYKFQWVYAGIGLAALLVVWVAGNESFGRSVITDCWRNLHPAIRVCKDQFCIFCSVHVLSVTGF